MITKERINEIPKNNIKEKMCLFCASDYHMEMIILPYIKKYIEDKNNIIILTENDLTQTINKLLDRVGINDNAKKEIKNLNWNKTIEKNKILDIIKNIDEKSIIIVNGNYKYIKEINEVLERNIYNDNNIINCFHIMDKFVNADIIGKKYKIILNTENFKNFY